MLVAELLKSDVAMLAAPRFSVEPTLRVMPFKFSVLVPLCRVMAFAPGLSVVDNTV